MFGHEHGGVWEKAGRAFGFAAGSLVFTTVLFLALLLSGRVAGLRGYPTAAALALSAIITGTAVRRALA